MLKQLQFGLHSTVEYSPRRELFYCEGPTASVPFNVRARAAEVLASPLEFPPLSKAVVSGDKVVLALEPELPQATALVAATIEVVLRGGASPDDITVLRAPTNEQSAGHDPRSDLPEPLRSSVRLATHHPGLRDELSYLGADDYGQPIYISRHLFDADVVVPISCARLDEALGYGGVHATLYPTFADQAAQERCRTVTANDRKLDGQPSSRRGGDRNARQSARGSGKRASISQRDAEQVAWLLGVLFCVQAVPGAAGDLIAVLAGQHDRVIARGRELCRQAWSVDVPGPVDLVVAAIEGDDEQQTWDNVGRAIAAAQRIVSENGAIAICTELAKPPGPGIRAVGAAENLEQAQRWLQKQRPLDAPVAHHWATALDHTRLYLLSRLDEQQVEDTGAAHVSNPGEIARLIEHTGSCVLLSNAQYVLPTTVES
jgi:nickel-dependent lactate racemase